MIMKRYMILPISMCLHLINPTRQLLNDFLYLVLGEDRQYSNRELAVFYGVVGVMVVVLGWMGSL